MKNLLERVKAHTKAQPAPVRDAAKIFIIAHRAEIQKTLDHGYTAKAIWETLKKEGKIDCGYARFCQKLKQHLYSRTTRQVATKITLKPPVTPRKPNMPKAEGFTFNATPKQEDLY